MRRSRSDARWHRRSRCCRSWESLDHRKRSRVDSSTCRPCFFWRARMFCSLLLAQIAAFFCHHNQRVLEGTHLRTNRGMPSTRSWQAIAGQVLADQFPIAKLLGAPDPTGEAGRDSLARLKKMHELSATKYGRIGERGRQLWHPALYEWGVPRSAVEAVHPHVVADRKVRHADVGVAVPGVDMFGALQTKSGVRTDAADK